MNSATLTETGPARPPSSGVRPWQFFLIAALGCSTAAMVMVRGQGATTLVLTGLLIISTALVGLAALRTLGPLVSPDAGSGYREEIEREVERRLGERGISAPKAGTCRGCATLNDPDAKFCKSCGEKL